MQSVTILVNCICFAHGPGCGLPACAVGYCYSSRHTPLPHIYDLDQEHDAVELLQTFTLLSSHDV